jgi:hypothetical protein
MATLEKMNLDDAFKTDMSGNQWWGKIWGSGQSGSDVIHAITYIFTTTKSGNVGCFPTHESQFVTCLISKKAKNLLLCELFLFKTICFLTQTILLLQDTGNGGK